MAGGQGVDDKAKAKAGGLRESRPMPRPDLFEVKSKAKATIFCPRAIPEVEDSSGGVDPSLC